MYRLISCENRMEQTDWLTPPHTSDNDIARYRIVHNDLTAFLVTVHEQFYNTVKQTSYDLIFDLAMAVSSLTYQELKSFKKFVARKCL